MFQTNYTSHEKIKTHDDTVQGLAHHHFDVSISYKDVFETASVKVKSVLSTDTSILLGKKCD